MDVKKLVAKTNIISLQMRPGELVVLLEELVKVIKNNVEGDVVEMGCYEGTSALFEQRVLQAMAPTKKLWLYDSFEGLPEKTTQDQSALGEAFKEGELKASKAVLAKNFVKAGLKIPEIKRAWFYELDPSDLPESICFAFLDGDFYESILDSLKLVYPKMSPGGVIVIDDYANFKLPGAKKAVNEFAAQHGITVTSKESLALLRV